jgi:cysteine desulfurase / selenocysteine lyase
MLCDEKGAHLRVAPINDAGEVILEEYRRLLGPRTKIVALAHVSNALGTLDPVKRMAEMAHARGVAVLLDGAQDADGVSWPAPRVAIDRRRSVR